MQEKNLTTQALTDKIGVNQTNISYWINCKMGLKLSTALRLCDFFECSIEYLLGRSDERLGNIPKPCQGLFYKRVIELLQQNDISYYKLEKTTHITQNHLKKWRNNADPLVYSLIFLADYFNVTLDYLVGRE